MDVASYASPEEACTRGVSIGNRQQSLPTGETPRLRLPVSGVVFLLALMLQLACSRPDARISDAPDSALKPNVILISIDTLRPDFLGNYGYPSATTPWMDRFRADATLYEVVVAHAPSTLMSHASIFSSLLPEEHGASFASGSALPEEVMTIAEVMAAAGYRTAAVTGGAQMDDSFGVDQGFGVYAYTRSDSFEETVDRASQWMASGAGPFFLFLHTYEVHHPYEVDRALTFLAEPRYSGRLPKLEISRALLEQINAGELELGPEDHEHIRALYAEEIRRMDSALGKLILTLRSMGSYDRAVIVLTSDHGEEFGEHGMMGWHSHSLHDELLRVPLLIKFPGAASAGQSVSGMARSIDIAPTILAAVGLEIPRQFGGVDLARGEPPADRAMAKVDWPSREILTRNSGDLSVVGVRTERWKLLSLREAGRQVPLRLFDLDSDPEERVDVSSIAPEVVQELLAAYPRPSPSNVLDQEPVNVDPQAREQLRALGYLP